MIKATTSHGTYYLIDFEMGRAVRVPAEGRNAMHSDGDWFPFFSVSSYDPESREFSETLTEGLCLYFQTRERMYDWRISTRVVSIEEVEVE